MSARAERDRKLKTAILKWAYEAFLQNPISYYRGADLPKEIGAEEKDVVYVLERLARNGLVKHEQYSGTPLGDVKIEPTGIDALAEEGHETILADNTRYDILKVLYEAKRADPHWGHLSREDLLKGVQGDAKRIDAVVTYLAEADLIDADGGGGGDAWYYDLAITDRGADAYETFEAHGVEGVQDVRDMWQVTIGPNARQQAQNLFRDITELARREIILIDRYAREPIFAMLANVPKGVSVLLLTEDGMAKQAYISAAAEAKKTHALDVRTLPKADWPFHSRYLIVDRDDAWVWDHSFHDAGETQHTVSSMKPVNRNKVLIDFDAAWPKGTII